MASQLHQLTVVHWFNRGRVVTKASEKMDENTENNVSATEAISFEFRWLEALIKYRITELCDGVQDTPLPGIPNLIKGVHPYFDWLIEEEVDLLERMVLSLALAARTTPQFLDYLYTKNQYTDQVFTEFGVRLEGEPLRLSPSWQTVFFLFLGTAAEQQFQLLNYVHPDHRLYVNNCLLMPEQRAENPFLTPLKLNSDMLRTWLYPAELRNVADGNFPAHEISSPLNWEDLFLNAETERGLNQLRLWLRHGDDLLDQDKFSKYINPGIRVLFYGPSGTGKTLTASLLGKEFKMPVYRLDLSQMVSKWIGETEKNLARVFDIAEKKKWILFFDEADSLFSKRSSVSSSNDRRANQEISYLLQRIENFDGTVIMASNLRENIDDAFIRRFQLMINFPMPDKTIREKLWTNMLDDTFELCPDLNLAQIAEDFEIAGGSMKNVFRGVVLVVADREESEQIITTEDVREMIQLGQSKYGIYTIQKRY